MVNAPQLNDEGFIAQWRASVPIVLLPFLLSRLWLGCWVYVGHLSWPYRQDVPGGFRGVDHWWLNPWTTYDSQHFLSIARVGYTPETSPFFPLYPLLLRAFGTNENFMAAGGVLLSNAAFFAGLVGLHALSQRDYNDSVAKLAIWLLAFFPTSIIFSAVYSDALYFALLMWAFWAARSGLWTIAGPLAFLAACTRNAGGVIALALFCEWWQQRREAKSVSWSAFLSALLPIAALLGVQCYFAQKFGGLAGIQAHQQYGRSWQQPWHPLANEAANILSGNGLDAVTLVNFLLTISAFALLWWQRRKMPIAYVALLLGILMMQLTLGRVTPPFTNTSARLLSTTFPFLQLLALAIFPLTKNKFRLVLASSIYLIIATLFAFLFGQKVFVCG